MTDKCNMCETASKVKGLRFCDKCANYIKRQLREKESYGTIHIRGVGGRKIVIN